MHKINKKAFTFVELLISISILIIISFIAYNSYSSYQDSANSSKIKGDLWTLENSLETYIEIEKKLPNPEWNNNYFDENSVYTHSSSWAFWIYWSATKNLLNSKFIDFIPRDPRLNTYYSYWKVLDPEKLEFEFAWVIKKDGEYFSIISWNYKSESWPMNLIREYNWPEFVYDNSTEIFAYNPYEKILTAKIKKLTWTVEIDWVSKNLLELEKIDLVEETKIETLAGSSVEIYFSDWSVSVLEANSILELKDMKYKDENSLFTNIKIVLSAWNIWTKATRLWDDSEFEIYTDDAVVAVRWTIFWVEKNVWNTSIKLIEWKVEIFNLSNTTLWDLDWENLETTITSWWWFSENPFTPTPEEEKTLNNFWKIIKNMRVELVSFSRYPNDEFEIKLKDIDFADRIKINWGLEIDKSGFKKWNFIVLNESIITGAIPNVIKISYCKDGICTEELEVKMIKDVDYGVKWSEMNWFEPFFENTLGNWKVESEGVENGDSLSLTGSSWNEIKWTKSVNSETIELSSFGDNSENTTDIRWWIYDSNIGNLYEKHLFAKWKLKAPYSNDYEIVFELEYDGSGYNIVYTSNVLSFDTNDLAEWRYNVPNNCEMWCFYNDIDNQWHGYCAENIYDIYDSSLVKSFNASNNNCSTAPPPSPDWPPSFCKYNKNTKKYELWCNWWTYEIITDSRALWSDSFVNFSVDLAKDFENAGFVSGTFDINDLTLNKITINVNKKDADWNWSIFLKDFKLFKKAQEINSWNFDLIAYAPYNKAGDLSLYKIDWTEFAIANSWWIINWNTWESFYYTCDENLSDNQNSFCQIWDKKWIFIDNVWNDDYLKYNFSNPLKSDEAFIIEMSVKTPEDSGTYYLLHSREGDDNNIRLFIKNKKLYFLDKGNFGFFTNIDSWKIQKIFLIKDKDKNVYLKIWNWKTIKTWKTIDNNINNIIVWAIWNGTSYTYQYNNLIDYIKIYK